MKYQFLYFLLIIIYYIKSDFIKDCELSSFNYCIKCNKENKYLHNGSCYTKVEHCRYYDSAEDYCERCEYGYEFDNNGKCIQCDDKNANCVKEIENCQPNEKTNGIVYSWRYYEGVKCDICQEGYGLSEDSSSCIKCKDDETGKGGKNNQVLFDRWTKCHKKIDNCSEYYLYGVSYTRDNNFLDNYYLKEDYGIGQGKDRVICVNCMDNGKKGLTQDRKACVKCANDQVSPFGECVKEISNCEEYNNDYTCKKCITKEFSSLNGYNYYYLDENNCKKCPLYQKSDGKKCFNFCKIFNSVGTCKRCDYNLYYDFRLEFDLNYYLEGNECKKCENNLPSNGIKCLDKIPNCKIHHFNDESNKLECYKCEKNYYRDKNKKCFQCQSGMISSGISCYNNIVIQNCEYQYEDICRECKTGFFESKDSKTCSECQTGQIKKNGECVNEKIEFCKKYSSEDVCEECIKNFEISENGKKCKQCYFPYRSEGIKCYLYRYHCLTHSPEGKCSVCYPGFEVNEQGGCSLKKYESYKNDNKNTKEQNNYNNNYFLKNKKNIILCLLMIISLI